MNRKITFEDEAAIKLVVHTLFSGTVIKNGPERRRRLRKPDDSLFSPADLYRHLAVIYGVHERTIRRIIRK